MNKRVKAIIEDESLLWKGHFLLASGKHSPIYWEKFRLLENPQLLAEICKPIVDRFSDVGADVVVGPTLGGVIVAFEVARQLGIRAAFAERLPEGKGRFFRPPVFLSDQSRVLIVDDVYMTGRTFRQVVAAIGTTGATIVGAGALIDRCNKFPDLQFPFYSVEHLEFLDYDSSNCPLCSQGIPLTKAAGGS